MRAIDIATATAIAIDIAIDIDIDIASEKKIVCEVVVWTVFNQSQEVSFNKVHGERKGLRSTGCILH